MVTMASFNGGGVHEVPLEAGERLKPLSEIIFLLLQSPVLESEKSNGNTQDFTRSSALFPSLLSRHAFLEIAVSDDDDEGLFAYERVRGEERLIIVVRR